MDSPPQWIFHVLKSCTYEDCFNLLRLNKAWYAQLENSVQFWETVCKRFAHEKKLYITPLDTCPGGHWRELFKELWLIREQFVQDNADIEAKRESLKFSIGVCVRFRPQSKHGALKGEGRKVVLPLHQRLPLIKAKYGNCSNSEAFKYMLKEQGQVPVADPWGNYELDEDDISTKENKRVVLNDGSSKFTEEKEMHNNRHESQASILAVREDEGTILAVAPGAGLREFKFDRVFDDGTSQKNVYDTSARRVVMDFINGFNGTIMVYGQTGSGKTYTMFGSPVEGNHVSRMPLAVEQSQGIVPRTSMEVLSALRQREDTHCINFKLCVTYVEIYGNDVYDLLRNGQRVGQSQVAGQRYVLDGQSEWPVHSVADIEKFLEEGDKQKHKASTAMNERSSRAHTVFILALSQTIVDSDAKLGRKVVSKLMLVDLGGSEKLSKSQVHKEVKSAGTVPWCQYYKHRQALQEAININSGLFVLKECIEALHERQKCITNGQEAPYVPFQDSKLTMILSSSLGGDSKTVLIITASKESQHAVESIQSLRFGEKCTSIENTATISTSSLVKALEEINVQIKECESQIKLHERWETRKTIRHDAIDGDEVVTTSVLVGAEIYQERLDKLLEKRQNLVGAS